MEEVEPGVYDAGALTQDGGRVMWSPRQTGLSARSAAVSSGGEYGPRETGPFAVFPGLDREGRLIGGEVCREAVGDGVGGGGEVMRRGIGSCGDHEVVLRCPPSGGQGDLVTLRREHGVEVAPATDGRRDTTRDGCAGVFAMEAKEGLGGGVGRDVNELSPNKCTRECDSFVTSTRVREYSFPRVHASTSFLFRSREYSCTRGVT
ncbi:hypothetical protein EDB89DRAFT_1911263 [Lactarius sanguifluus]|nr:hypothetical protein EDB89DRAFT_1911263 [Lactarius sanguifluus]